VVEQQADLLLREPHLHAVLFGIFFEVHVSAYPGNGT
jgi:hypothetical protein